MNLEEAWKEHEPFLRRYRIRSFRIDPMERFSAGIDAFMEATARWEGCRYMREGRTFRDWLKHLFRVKLCRLKRARFPGPLRREPIVRFQRFDLVKSLEGDQKIMVETLLDIDTSGYWEGRVGYHSERRRHGFLYGRITNILHARMRAIGWSQERIQATSKQLKEALLS